MCLNPKRVLKAGNYKEDNYRGFKGDRYELNTFGDCCACEECQTKRSNNWVVRNCYEARAHEKKCFITLTYEKQPFFLVRKDAQDFIKRFRYEINKTYLENLKKFKKSIKGANNEKNLVEAWKEVHKDEYTRTKVFYAGEYGSRGRPHFHLIIYGWQTDTLVYMGLNKKLNIIYRSDLIQKVWGLGRTTYQEFGDFEAQYIALYNTPKETFAKSYKLSLAKIKKIRDFVKSKIGYYKDGQRENLLKELAEHERNLNEEKAKYIAIKEFNGWSQSLGFDEFFKEYAKNEEYTFTEYIYDREYFTPSSWLKKLANKYGDVPAGEELLKRERDLIKSATEEEERRKNRSRIEGKKTKEIIDWNLKGKNIIEEF